MKTYSITEVSKMYHLPPTTLRYYEELGLLYDVPRRGNRRVYRDVHLARLSAICCFKNAGMSLSELQQLFSYNKSGEDLNKIITLLSDHCQQIDQQLKLLQANQQQIKRKLDFYQHIRQAETTKTPLPDWDDYRTKNY